ncbi:hypothetical protein HanOQP8_Chr10g0369671 [Helianthus annuus]|nr:hypothetical protein HanOQP8_Chr10g0369671 [Helianthus annuus]KAJ0884174.1 hypothetical protein HanPSC8_Chr10g0430391 [Helianthus annuus]
MHTNRPNITTSTFATCRRLPFAVETRRRCRHRYSFFVFFPLTLRFSLHGFFLSLCLFDSDLSVNLTYLLHLSLTWADKLTPGSLVSDPDQSAAQFCLIFMFEICILPLHHTIVSLYQPTNQPLTNPISFSSIVISID